MNKRNHVASDLRDAEIKSFSQDIDVNISDTNKTWKIRRQIISVGKSKVSNSHNFCINENSVNNSLEIANAFNDFSLLLVHYWPTKYLLLLLILYLTLKTFQIVFVTFPRLILYIWSGFVNQLACLVIFSLPFWGNRDLLFHHVEILLTCIVTGFKSAE